MNLKLSLPERPGLLHALPVCDLLLMLWIAFVLGSALSRQSGVAVQLPNSQFQLERYRDTLVVTLAYGEAQPRLYLGRDAVSFEELATELTRLHNEGVPAHTILLLRTDRDVPAGAQRRVEELALGLNFKVALVGSEEPERQMPPAPSPKSVKPKPEAD